jgi:hypothetical protein
MYVRALRGKERKRPSHHGRLRVCGMHEESRGGWDWLSPARLSGVCQKHGDRARRARRPPAQQSPRSLYEMRGDGNQLFLLYLHRVSNAAQQ